MTLSCEPLLLLTCVRDIRVVILRAAQNRHGFASLGVLVDLLKAKDGYSNVNVQSEGGPRGHRASVMGRSGWVKSSLLLPFNGDSRSLAKYGVALDKSSSKCKVMVLSALGSAGRSFVPFVVITYITHPVTSYHAISSHIRRHHHHTSHRTQTHHMTEMQTQIQPYPSTTQLSRLWWRLLQEVQPAQRDHWRSREQTHLHRSVPSVCLPACPPVPRRCGRVCRDALHIVHLADCDAARNKDTKAAYAKIRAQEEALARAMDVRVCM